MKTRNLRNFLAVLAIGAAVGGAAPAFAHGAAKPQNGGVVSAANDLSFELVGTADGAALYIIDHDEKFDASKISGKLTVLNGTEKSEADLKPAGGNKLEAKGVKVGKGAKAVATLSNVTSKAMTVRWTVK